MKYWYKKINQYKKKIIRCQRLFSRFYIRQFKVFSRWYKRQRKKTIKQIQSQLGYFNLYWRKKTRKPKIFIANCYGRLYQAYYIGQKKMTVLGLAMLVVMFMISQIGLTASFFSDEEISPDNYWLMATLYIDANRVDFAPTVSDTQTATANVVVANNGQLKIKYNTTLQNTTGVLCPALNLKIYRGATLLYDGPIQDNATWSDNSLLAGGSGDYDLSAIMTTNDETLQTQTCQFNMAFQGWQEEINDSQSGGYTDQTIVQLTINSGEWQEEGESCTLTQGYWKTHSKYGPAPHDDTWTLLGEDTIFYLSELTYYDVINTPPAGGNSYFSLAHQYIAAVLNQLNGASVPTEVQTAITSAADLFGQYTPADIGALAGNNPVKQQFNTLAELLDDYNNGLIGPGHCDD